MTTPKKVAAPKAKAAPKAVTAVDDPALAEQAAEDDATGDELDETSQADAALDAGAASGVEGAPPETIAVIFDRHGDGDPVTLPANPPAVDPLELVPFPDAGSQFPVGPHADPAEASFDRPPAVEAAETTPERPFPVMSDPVRIPPKVF